MKRPAVPIFMVERAAAPGTAWRMAAGGKGAIRAKYARPPGPPTAGHLPRVAHRDEAAHPGGLVMTILPDRKGKDPHSGLHAAAGACPARAGQAAAETHRRFHPAGPAPREGRG